MNADDLYINYAPDKLDDIAHRFNEHGVMVVRNVVPLEIIRSFRDNIKRLILARFASVHQSVDENLDLDALFNQLCARDRRFGGEIYDYVRDLPDFYRMVHADPLKIVIGRLLNNTLLQCPFDLSLFHISRPNEPKYSYSWHQDYTYNLMSRSTVTVWMPLTDTGNDLGALHVVPGSHREIQEVIVLNPNFRSGQGGGGQVYAFKNITNEEMDRRSVQVPVMAGDALYTHSLTLHRSGANVADRSRWVVNPRYGDFLDKELVARGWMSGRGEHKQRFSLVHPLLAEERAAS
jgi:ectoine hydroxylase-related dioxygenase (phytanoyl-CoA dioxygenase family)